MSNKVMYFAYGSNMSSKWLLKRIPYAKFIGSAKLPNKQLICNKKSIDGSGKANLENSVRDVVWGVLYEIDLSGLKILDRIEKGYKQIDVEVVTDQGSRVEAYTYISNELTDDSRPYDCYKELLIKGALEHQLPKCYVEYLKQIDSKPKTS